jgi:hypothetical protein
MIRTLRNTLRRCRLLGEDRKGSMAIETALVAPMLILLSIGGFETSRMVARQHELQNGVAEAEAVALAANMGAETKTTELEEMLRSSLSLDGEQVKVKKRYRCAGFNNLTDSSDNCWTDKWKSTYIEISIKDSYTPIWTRLGIAPGFQYNVKRRVQLS